MWSFWAPTGPPKRGRLDGARTMVPGDVTLGLGSPPQRRGDPRGAGALRGEGLE